MKVSDKLYKGQHEKRKKKKITQQEGAFVRIRILLTKVLSIWVFAPHHPTISSSTCCCPYYSITWDHIYPEYSISILDRLAVCQCQRHGHILTSFFADLARCFAHFYLLCSGLAYDFLICILLGCRGLTVVVVVGSSLSSGRISSI